MGSKERASNITNRFIEELKDVDDPLPFLINKQFTKCATCKKLRLCTGYFLPPLKETHPELKDRLDLDEVVTVIKLIESISTKEQRIKLIEDILDILGIDDEFMMEVLEDLFQSCYQYNYIYQSITDSGYENRVVIDEDRDSLEDRPEHFIEMFDNLKELDNEYSKKYCMAINIVYSKCANCRIRNTHGGQILNSMIKKLMDKVIG